MCSPMPDGVENDAPPPCALYPECKFPPKECTWPECPEGVQEAHTALPEWLQKYVDSLSETHDVFINGCDVMILKKQPK